MPSLTVYVFLFQPTLPTRGATVMNALRTLFSLFQPTLPTRGATFFSGSSINSSIHFNPRSPHGERR